MFSYFFFYFFLFYPLESWKKYLHKIDRATANYQDCSNKKCACYSDVIDDDLRIWKERGWIKKSDFDNTDGRGVHYQIINHKLYREDSCMFPFRLVHWLGRCSLPSNIKKNLQFQKTDVFTYPLDWKVILKKIPLWWGLGWMTGFPTSVNKDSLPVYNMPFEIQRICYWHQQLRWSFWASWKTSSLYQPSNIIGIRYS